MTQGLAATFKYDPFGRRIQTVFTQNSTTTTTNYLYDGDSAIETVDQNGNVLTKFAQGQSIDEPLAESVGGATYSYEQDGLGSVTSLTNSTGGLSLTYTYDSFGKITNSQGTVSNPLRYTGRDFDSETGLSYYRARYYDPTSGRFISEDPGRFPGGIDFYTFVENDPVGMIDPFGFCPWQVHYRPMRGFPGSGPLGIDHYYFYNPQTGQSLGLDPAGGASIGTIVGSPVSGQWDSNEKAGDNAGPVPDWACKCVEKKVKKPGKPPKYCSYEGNRETNPHPPCTNCIGWVISVLQDCYNQAYQGQQ